MFRSKTHLGALLAVLAVAGSLAVPAGALAAKSARDPGLARAQQAQADHDPGFSGIGRKAH